jgi:hypothetical protein
MQTEIIIDENLAIKVKDTVSHGLCKGLGKPELGQMCVEAAVNYACGLPHGDNPSCVGSAVRSFKMRLNDAKWTSNDARAKGMLKIAIGQLGSNTINQVEFAKIVAFKTITVLMPVILRDRGFETEAVLCEGSKNLKEAKANIWTVKSKFWSAAVANAANATDAADGVGRGVAAVAYAAAAADVYATTDDKYLLISANICLEALIELKSPGCKFLYLCD